MNRTFAIPSPLAAEAMDFLTSHYFIDTAKYDIIVGLRADDSYFSFAQDFLNGSISIRQLGNAMDLGRLGMQTVLKSKRAFDRLSFIGAEAALSAQWHESAMRRDRQVRRDYLDRERNARQPGDIYITDLLEGSVNPDDPRI